MLVWILDDDEDIRTFLESMVTGLGHECQTYATAKAITEAIGQSTPDVLLCDVYLGPEDGLNVIKTLVDNKIHVVAMSATESTLETAREYGAHATLQKPFSVDDLRLIFDRVG